MLALLGVALFVAFLGLGSWQLQRRAWKLALIERVTERVRAPAVAAPAPAQWPQVNATQYEYLPVTLTGRFLPHKTVLTQAATELGSGFWVLTPLQAADGSQTLINRGFVPASDRQTWLPESGAPASESEPQTITGLLRITEPGGGFLRDNDAQQQRWYSRDVAAIAAAQGLTQAAPYFIDEGRPGLARATAGASPVWPRPGMTVIAFNNSHLVYALTWFGMALMVLAAAVVVVRWEKRRAGSAHKTL